MSEYAASDAATLHVPVLLEEVLTVLAPQDGGRYLDGTVGLGGHAEAMLRRGAWICGLDRDESALRFAGGRLGVFGEKARLFSSPFSEFAAALDELGWDDVNGMLLDIGVSSMQLDTAERGFSFMADGPLDMRMSPGPGKASAWHLVNRERPDALKRIIAEFGEDPQAGRIVRYIVEERQKKPIDSTMQLAGLVERAYPHAWRIKSRNHPATRTFQALRMAVNDELGELRRFLDRALSRLRAGGRLAIITFHSLEDRMVKHAMREWARACLCPPYLPQCICNHVPEARVLTRKPICASSREIADNPRASSAKLRAVEKIAPAVDDLHA